MCGVYYLFSVSLNIVLWYQNKNWQVVYRVCCCYLRQDLCSPSWPQIFDPALASQLFGLLCLVSDVSSSKLVGLKWGKGGCLCMQIKLMIWLGSSFSQFKYISVMSSFNRPLLEPVELFLHHHGPCWQKTGLPGKMPLIRSGVNAVVVTNHVTIGFEASASCQRGHKL